MPGVLRGIPGANIDGAGSLAWRASASFSANGQRSRDNNYMLDGVDNNETWLQTVVIFPSVDALDEFKLQTSTYSAEFGRSLGGVVNLQIKSGTNSYRGSAFEFHRNDALDANNFFNNRAGRAKPDFTQNQFGGTFGGPIFQDKTFFFADYQGHREKLGHTFLSTVPSNKMRAGDFSEISRVIYDPATGQPFPGSFIPSDRWDDASTNILRELYPAPNTAGTIGAAGQPINNYLINPVKERQDNQFDLKVDHNLSTNNRFFTRYSYQKVHRLQPATLEHGDAGATFGAGDGNITAQGAGVQRHAHLWQQLAERVPVRLVADRIRDDVDRPRIEPRARDGHPGHQHYPAVSAMSQLTFQNIRNLGANSNQPLITNQNDFQIFDNVTWIKGKHTLKSGGSITFRSREILNADNPVGQFQFNNNQTSNCAGQPSTCVLNSTTGFDVASFLLGYTFQKIRNLSGLAAGEWATYKETRPEFSLYVQDDWRATQKLTLNLGLRWDVYPPWIEIDDRQSNFDVTTGDFVIASDNAQIGGIEVGRRLQTYSKGDFGPRLGFAYDVFGDGNTLVRGGYGVFWNFTPGGTSSSKAQNQPFLDSAALTPTPVSSTGVSLRLEDGLPPPTGGDPVEPAGQHALHFRSGVPRRLRAQLQRERAARHRDQLPHRGRICGLARPAHGDQNRHQSGAASHGPRRCERQPPVHCPGEGHAVDEPVAGDRRHRSQRPAAQVPASLREQLLVHEQLHAGQDDGLRVRQRGRDHEQPGSRLQLGAGGLRRAPHVQLAAGSTRSRGRARSCMADGRPTASWYWRTGLPFTITQAQGVRSTGTGNRPNQRLRRRVEQSDR